jgi:hypothetical protein
MGPGPAGGFFDSRTPWNVSLPFWQCLWPPSWGPAAIRQPRHPHRGRRRPTRPNPSPRRVPDPHPGGRRPISGTPRPRDRARNPGRTSEDPVPVIPSSRSCCGRVGPLGHPEERSSPRDPPQFGVAAEPRGARPSSRRAARPRHQLAWRTASRPHPVPQPVRTGATAPTAALEARPPRRRSHRIVRKSDILLTLRIPRL